MARLNLASRKVRQQKKFTVILLFWMHILNLVDWFFQLVSHIEYQVEKYTLKGSYSLTQFSSMRMNHLTDLISESDMRCIDHLRMDRRTFRKLCMMLRTTGQMKDSRHVTLEEQVALFLNILAHHSKNRIVRNDFKRSGWTISVYFNKVLNGVLRLHGELLKKPTPIGENSRDERWRWFKDCLGALDGKYINVRVPEVEKPRYRNRKGGIAINMLGVCAPDLQFIYVLSGWEGSAADARVLEDALTRRNGLRVPHGNYYLVDGGYTNCEGFLAPFRGQRYHLSEWRDGQQPTSAEEFFNMKHAAARNVIERSFGILTMRWAILRSPSFYPIKIQNRIIMACCLLHNLIRKEMANDPMEEQFETRRHPMTQVTGEESIASIESTQEWTNKRTMLATEMFEEWRASRGG